MVQVYWAVVAASGAMRSYDRIVLGFFLLVCWTLTDAFFDEEEE